MNSRTIAREVPRAAVAPQSTVRTIDVPSPTRASGDANERRLIEGCRRGEPWAYRLLVEQNGGRMLAAARQMLSSDEDARDTVQDAFLSAFRAIDGFEGTARISTWLHRILLNAALMKLRTRRRRPEQPIDDMLPEFDDEGAFAATIERQESASDVLLDRRETHAAVRRAIESLPDSYRTVLLLRDLEERDTDETAQALGMTASAVKTRLHRARQVLRTLLVREGLA